MNHRFQVKSTIHKRNLLYFWGVGVKINKRVRKTPPTAYHAFVVIKNFLLIDLQIKVDHQIHISFVVAEPFLDCVGTP